MSFRKHNEGGWGQTIVSGFIAMIYFAPVFWMILTSFKTRQDALAIPPKLFFTPTLDNFKSVFWETTSSGEVVSTDAWLYFANSAFIAGSSVLLALIIGTLAAYAFSRYPLKGNDTYLFIILTTRMLPPIVVIIPIFLLFRITGLSGSYIGIILLYTSFNLPFSIWMMKSFFDDLDREVEDSARMDGSNDWVVFGRIVLPQVFAGLAATLVFALILTWNEFIFALLLTGPETRTVPVAIASTIGGSIGVDWGKLSAMITLFLIPVFIVTFALQSQLLRGVTFGTIRK